MFRKLHDCYAQLLFANSRTGSHHTGQSVRPNIYSNVVCQLHYLAECVQFRRMCTKETHFLYFTLINIMSCFCLNYSFCFNVMSFRKLHDYGTKNRRHWLLADRQSRIISTYLLAGTWELFAFGLGSWFGNRVNIQYNSIKQLLPSLTHTRCCSYKTCQLHCLTHTK